MRVHSPALPCALALPVPLASVSVVRAVGVVPARLLPSSHPATLRLLLHVLHLLLLRHLHLLLVLLVHAVLLLVLRGRLVLLVRCVRQCVAVRQALVVVLLSAGGALAKGAERVARAHEVRVRPGAAAGGGPHEHLLERVGRTGGNKDEGDSN